MGSPLIREVPLGNEVDPAVLARRLVELARQRGDQELVELAEKLARLLDVSSPRVPRRRHVARVVELPAMEGIERMVEEGLYDIAARLRGRGPIAMLKGFVTRLQKATLDILRSRTRELLPPHALDPVLEALADVYPDREAVEAQLRGWLWRLMRCARGEEATPDETRRCREMLEMIEQARTFIEQVRNPAMRTWLKEALTAALLNTMLRRRPDINDLLELARAAAKGPIELAELLAHQIQRIGYNPAKYNLNELAFHLYNNPPPLRQWMATGILIPATTNTKEMKYRGRRGSRPA